MLLLPLSPLSRLLALERDTSDPLSVVIVSVVGEDLIPPLLPVWLVGLRVLSDMVCRSLVMMVTGALVQIWL